jgi:hypothetical protein
LQLGQALEAFVFPQMALAFMCVIIEQRLYQSLAETLQQELYLELVPLQQEGNHFLFAFRQMVKMYM